MFQEIRNALVKRRNENQKQFFVGLAVDGGLFLLGIILLIFPSILADADLNSNNMLVIVIAAYSLCNLIKFIVFNERINEKIYNCLAGSAIGILNIILCGFLNDNSVFTMTLMVFTLVMCGVKLFTIDFYHERNDSYWYIETMLISIFVVLGIVISLTVLSNNTYQVLSLGFFTIIISILDTISTSIKCMLRSRRFTKNIKLK